MLKVKIHPSAIVDSGAIIGAGSSVWHFAHVCSSAIVGENCSLGQNVFVADQAVIGNSVKIQNNVSIYGGVTLEDEVFLGPSCVLTNISNPRSQVSRKSLYEKTLIRRGATVGANATIVCGVTLGRYCFIGAGAVVTKDVSDYGLILGSPGKLVGHMSRHGHRLNFGENDQTTCPESKYKYEKSGDSVRCLDLEEESPLPSELSSGTVSYGAFKR
jgi:UDP-2-acetamido-3-amino-2,3-dideoxy-glucuronate N-acetyltransferase